MGRRAGPVWGRALSCITSHGRNVTTRLPLVVRIDEWLGRQSRGALLLAGLGMVAGLGYLDFATGPELTPLIFYLIPIVFVAWYAGTGLGAVVATASGLAWLLSDVLTHGRYAHPIIPYWNVAMQLAALLLAAWTVARLRGGIEREMRLARTDHLTGAANLRAFYEIAAAELIRARRYPHPFTVAYIDLDDFKRVNDRLGHRAGDVVLRSVVRMISGALRATDTLARTGGDEFVVLLPETETAAAQLVMQKLQQALSEIVLRHGWRVSASIGVVTYLVPPDSVDALVGGADRLMYASKRKGKNLVSHQTRNDAVAVP